MKKILITSILAFISILLVAETNILPPQLVAPVNDAVKQMPDATLDWFAVSGIGEVSYLLEVDTDNNFTNPMSFTTSVTSEIMELLSFGQLYYWHVKAMDDNGESDWSETFAFTVFERMELNKPDDGDEDLDPKVELKWKGAFGPTQVSGFDFIDIMYDTTNYWESVYQDITTNDLFGVYFLNEDLGYVSAASGEILKYDAGVWMLDTIYDSEGAATTISDDLVAMTFNDSGLGYIAGESGTLIQFDGDNWVLEPIMLTGSTDPYTENLTDVSVLNEDQVWVCNDDGDILTKTTDGWELSEVGSDPYLALAFLDEDNGWAVGEKGQVAFYNGTEWTEEESLTGDDLFAVAFVNANNGYAVGESGTMLHYDGTEWMEIESNSKMDLFFIDVVDENDIWAGGEDGRLVFFDGESWVELASSTIEVLNGFHGLNETDGWIVGENGTVLQRNANGFNSPAMQVITTSGENSSFILTELYFGKNYYWKIRARHDADTSFWSSTQYFATLAQPTLDAPSDNAVHQMIDVELSWAEIDGAFEYTIQLCDEPTFIGGCTFFADENSLNTQNLLFGTTYYWHVKALHTQDTSQWSDGWSFTTIDKLDLVSPEDESFVDNIFPTFEWEEITGVDGFELVYGLNDNFVDAEMVDIEAPANDFSALSPLVEDETYFWKLRSYRDGDTTLWSDVWSFTIGEDTVGISQNVFNEHTVNIYPNPAKSELFIDINVEQQRNVNIRIMDVLGKAVIEEKFTSESGMNTHRIETSELENGLYIVRVVSGESYYSMKFLIDN